MNIEKKLDLLKEEVRRKEFLSGKRMGGEIPFHIFDYLPQEEQIVRLEIPKMIEQLKKENIIVIEIDLYELCLEIIESKVGLNQIIDFEKSKGSENLLQKLKIMLDFDFLNTKINEKIGNEYNIIIITGVGKIWPIIRTHNLLNNLQNIIEKPLILFYPGEYSGLDLSLFGILKSSEYYRANKLINIKQKVL